MSPPGFRLFSPPSRGSFQLSLTVLVRYRSRDVFRLGSWWLPASHGQTRPWYSGPRREPRWFSLRGFHPLRRSVPAHFGYHRSAPRGSKPQPWTRNPTSPPTHRRGIWFGLSPFRSPLLRGSRLVSLPPPTKMFPFGGFPPLTGRHGLLARGRRSHSGIPGSTAACAYPGHIAACRALPRRPSRAIHQAAAVPQTGEAGSTLYGCPAPPVHGLNAPRRNRLGAQPFTLEHVRSRAASGNKYETGQPRSRSKPSATQQARSQGTMGASQALWPRR